MAGIVVIGAGQAGAALVARLRKSGHTGPITLIGAEPVLPYQRPPLSKKYLLGQMTAEALLLRPAAFYAAQDISVRLGAAVLDIDPVARRIRLADEELAYDQLALTTGSIARHLPAALGGDLARVHAVRSLADVQAMAHDFATAQHVLVVGGGYVGLEAAAVAAARGQAVTVLEIAPRILQRVACTETADYFRALHAGRGVSLREGVGLVRLSGPGRVTAADLSDGTRLEVDMVIVGIGIDPDTRLAQAAGLALDNGIATDAFGATSQPGIWAAGDCASFPWRGGRIRLESVQNAVDQADCVADNMLGAMRPYTPQPWFWSDQYDVKLQIAGLGTGHRQVVVRGGDHGPRSHWYFGDQGLLAVDAMNDPRSFMLARRLLQAGTPVDPQAVADPGTDLRALLGEPA